MASTKSDILDLFQDSPSADMAPSQAKTVDLFQDSSPTEVSEKAPQSAMDSLAAAFADVQTHKQEQESPPKAKTPTVSPQAATPKTPPKAASRKAKPGAAMSTQPATSRPQKEEPSAAPESQSRQPYVLDEEAEASTVPNRQHVKQVLEGCDADLRWALSGIVGKLAEKWLVQVADIKPSDLESHRSNLKTDVNRQQLYPLLLRQFTQKRASAGHQPSEEEIKKIKGQIKEHDEEIMNHIIDLVFRLAREKSDSGKEVKLSPEIRRQKTNRTLRLIRRKATCYELLGVKRDATTSEIKSAWKGLAAALHPDHNKDVAAEECMAAVNAAKDLLSSKEKRQIYDAFLRDNPPPKATEDFDEDFASNAFGDDDDDDNSIYSEGDDSAEDEETHYPPPTSGVRKLHDGMAPKFEAFFKDMNGPLDTKLMSKIDKRNKLIEHDNEQRKRPDIRMYGVPRDKLLFYRFAQRRIAVSFETGLWDAVVVRKELQWLQNHFTKTRSRGLYQWPEAWTQLVMEPLSKKLATLGVSKDEQKPVAEPHAAEDDMDTTYGSAAEEDYESDALSVQSQRQPVRTLQPLNAGFTMLGDEILGYMPVERRSKFLRNTMYLTGFKMFVKVKETGRFTVTTGSDVGGMAAVAYHDLPEEDKNNVKKNEKKYADASALEFNLIRGVAWVPGTSQPTRLPDTYVWVEMKTKSQHADIMTRSTFRQWLGKGLADKLIDSWLVDNNITPEWSTLGFSPDPANSARYLSLTYPAPRQPRQDGYDMRPRIQGSDMQALTSKFDRLLEMFIEDRKEAREDRKQQQEIMMRLLPAPN
ncbi:hypothetical protein ACHAO5_001661 [Verticillium nonalfalfae]